LGSAINPKLRAPYRHGTQDYKYHYLLGTCNLHCNSNLFYNQKPGGHKGTHSAAAKKVMSDKAKLRRYSDDSKAQRSIRMTGQGNHFYNKNHTDEAKTKIKDKRALQVITEDTKLKISNTIKTLPKFQCSTCHGWYFKRNLVQHHNEKCKKTL
jgi:hypothetical protein